MVPHSWQLWASTLSWVSCTCFCSMYSVTYFLSHTEHVHCLPTAHTCVCGHTCTHTHTHKDEKRSTGHERGRPTVHRTGGEAASPFARAAGFVRQVGAWDQAARLGRVWGAPSLAERGATLPLWYREVRDWVSEVEVGSFLGAQGPPLCRVAPDILKRSPPRPRGCPCARRAPSGCAPLTCVDELVGLHRVSLTERLPTQFAHEVFNPCRGHTSVTEPQRTRGVLSLTCLGTWRGRRGQWTAGASAHSCPRSSENWRLRPAPRGLGQLLPQKGWQVGFGPGLGDCQTVCASGV